MSKCAIRGLSAFWFLFAFYWYFWFGMRAEIRWKETILITGENSTKTRHEANSLWMRIDCPDWDDAYTGSKQPVKCTIYLFDGPGMKVALFGWIICLLSTAAYYCCLDSPQKRRALVVIGGGSVLMFIGWLVVLTDDSYMTELAWSWFFGMLCGPFYLVFTAFVFLQQQMGRKEMTR